jgi:hypothetical protein
MLFGFDLSVALAGAADIRKNSGCHDSDVYVGKTMQMSDVAPHQTAIRLTSGPY